MRETDLKAGSRTSLQELIQAGIPVDLSVVAETAEKQKIEIEQCGGVHESLAMELENGRIAVIAQIAVANHITRPIDVLDIKLEAPWGENLWQWLKPKQIKYDYRAKDALLPIYRFPGKPGFELPYDEVLNQS